MSEQSYDLIVIGSGPGGYVCAFRAAQLGLNVAVVEKDPHRGGTCLNVGCIPSKALLHTSHLFAEAQHGESQGIMVKDLKIDVPRMMERKDKVVQQLRNGVDGLLKKRKITVLQGTGRLLGNGKVEIEGKDAQTVSAANIVIATGSVPAELPSLPFDGTSIVSSDQAIAFEKVPGSLLVVGGGAIGLELGSVWARLGSKVTVVEFLPSIAAGADPDISKFVERVFKKQGITIDTDTKVTGASKKGKKVQVTAQKKEKEIQYEAEKVLVAVGRKPFTEGLGLDKVGVKLDDRGRIEVDEKLRTSAKGIWAIGDVVPGPMLAHKAEEDGVAVAEWIAGKAGHIDWSLVPGVYYTHPEIALVGLSESAAKEKGISVKTGKFSLAANGRAIASDATDGMVKLIADAKTDKLLGAAIVAAGASEMIASVVAHMTYGGSSEDLARTIHAHPTLSEAIKEAAMAVEGWAIHSA